MNVAWDVNADGLRPDQAVIAAMVPNGAQVLDVGSGDGQLLRHLVEVKGCKGRGLELSQDLVSACVGHGLSVIQGDADTDLGYYPDDAFDIVILSQTLQATNRPKDVVAELLRIGRRAIVSFPNFGHWRVRLQLAWRGRMPVSDYLSYQWYDTPNIHFCTIRDFKEMIGELNAVIDRAIALDDAGRSRSIIADTRRANLLGQQAVFLLERG